MLLPSTAIRHRDMFGIILVVTLKFQEIIVPAPVLVGIFPANRRTGTVNRAATRIRVEKPADPPEVLVLFAAHDALVAMVGLREFTLGFANGDVVVFG